MRPDSILGHYAREARKRHRRERCMWCITEGLCMIGSCAIVGLIVAFFIIKSLGV